MLRGALFQVELTTNEQVDILPDDRLGFTYEHSTPISYQFVDGHPSYIRNVHVNGTDDYYPTIGSTYTFIGLAQSRVFSIAAEIEPCKFLHRLTFMLTCSEGTSGVPWEILMKIIHYSGI